MRSQGGTFPVTKERNCSYPSAPHKRCRSILCVSACPRVCVVLGCVSGVEGGGSARSGPSWRGHACCKGHVSQSNPSEKVREV